jgi:hypothetical protein
VAEPDERPTAVLLIRAWRDPAGVRARIIQDRPDENGAGSLVFTDAAAVAAFVHAWLDSLPPAE